MRLSEPPYPYVEVVITIGTWEIVENVYLDTGHEGGLAIPEYLQADIWARPVRQRFQMADGSVLKAPTWSGTVQIGDKVFRTEVSALGPRFLLGREVLDHVTVCFERGRRVSIEF